ncbi:MAG TPA: hypothetical protein VGM83_05230 [Devosiaceae bacterium]|jgi:hypothetical protein
MEVSAKRQAAGSIQHLGFNLLAITLILAICGLSVAYGIDALVRLHHAAMEDDSKVVASNLAGRTLTIPTSWLPAGAGGVEGFASQIALRLSLPLGPDQRLAAVEVTLVPHSQARASASLLDGLYLHLFKANEIPGPPGLIGKPLNDTDGFAGETVWYDPLSPSPFVAKCMQVVAGKGEDRCLRTVVLKSGIAAIYSFGADLLPAWRDFDAVMNERLERIGAL